MLIVQLHITNKILLFFPHGIYSIAFYKKLIYLEFNLGKVNGKFSMKFYSGRMSGINFYMRNCLFGLWNFRNEEKLLLVKVHKSMNTIPHI